jgi:hypothetical protein
LGAIDKEQEQGFLLLPNWQPELGNESLLLGNTVDEFIYFLPLTRALLLGSEAQSCSDTMLVFHIYKI